MSRDVCWTTKRRCDTPDVCLALACPIARAQGKRFFPTTEDQLTRAEKYHLVMSERRAEASKHG